MSSNEDNQTINKTIICRTTPDYLGLFQNRQSGNTNQARILQLDGFSYLQPETFNLNSNSNPDDNDEDEHEHEDEEVQSQSRSQSIDQSWNDLKILKITSEAMESFRLDFTEKKNKLGFLKLFKRSTELNEMDLKWIDNASSNIISLIHPESIFIEMNYGKISLKDSTNTDTHPDSKTLKAISLLITSIRTKLTELKLPEGPKLKLISTNGPLHVDSLESDDGALVEMHISEEELMRQLNEGEIPQQEDSFPLWKNVPSSGDSRVYLGNSEEPVCEVIEPLLNGDEEQHHSDESNKERKVKVILGPVTSSLSLSMTPHWFPGDW